MARKKRQVAEFRYYKMPDNCALFALLGERWRQKYERDIDFLHFHNYLEIGYCYDGSRRITCIRRTVRPGRSAAGNIFLWMWTGFWAGRCPGRRGMWSI